MVTSKQVEDFIEEWLEMFPKTNVVPFEGYAKGKGKDSVKKMQKLCKQNKDWTIDIVFNATKLYLTEKEKNNWAFLSRPYYFICKNNISLLEEYVERFLSGQKSAEQVQEYNSASDFI